MVSDYFVEKSVSVWDDTSGKAENVLDQSEVAVGEMRRILLKNFHFLCGAQGNIVTYSEELGKQT